MRRGFSDDYTDDSEKPVRDDYFSNGRADCVARLYHLCSGNTQGKLEICAECDGVDRGVCKDYLSMSEISDEKLEEIYALRRNSSGELGEEALTFNQKTQKILEEMDLDIYQVRKLKAIKRHSIEDYNLAVDPDSDTVIMSGDDVANLNSYDSVEDEINEGRDIDEVVRMFRTHITGRKSKKSDDYRLPRPPRKNRRIRGIHV